MNKVVSLAIYWLFAVLPLAPSQAQAVDFTAPPPKNLAVHLKLPASAVIGQHVEAEFVIGNTGTTAFDIYAQEQPEAEVKDAKGIVVPPDSPGFSLGAHSIGTLVAPGKTESLHFALDKFTMILAPGRYTVSAWDGLGWKMDWKHPHPVATAQIEFTRPTAKDARAWVHDLCTNENRPGPFRPDQLVWETGWELEHLYDPAYLEPLREEARAGHTRACLGLGSIVAEGANETLLELARSDDVEMVRAAASALWLRLPFRGGPDLRDPRQSTWQTKFDQPVRELAVKLLSGKLGQAPPAGHSDAVTSFYLHASSSIELGAVILQKCVSSNEADAVLQVTDQELRRHPKAPSQGVFVPSVMWPDHPLFYLRPVIDGLRKQGWRMTDAGHFGAGSLLAFCRQLADPAIPKPEGQAWQDSVRTALRDPSPILRENAVRAIPLPLTEEWARLLRDALKDSDGDVLQAACEVAGNSGNKEMIDPLLRAITTGPEHILVPGAAEAAEKLGAGVKVWRALAEAITNDDKASRAVLRLVTATIELPPPVGDSPWSYGWTPEQCTVVREAWKTFLDRNRAILKSGRRVPRDDPSVDPALTGSSFPEGRSFSVRLNDGTHWPPLSKTGN